MTRLDEAVERASRLTPLEQAMRTALETIKSRVSGDRGPNWQSDWATTQSRMRIADVCDAALAHAAEIERQREGGR